MVVYIPAPRYTPTMFVRIKTTPNSPRRSVQLVEAVRDGGRVRQRIVRHIGVAMDEDELERLRQLGEYVKAKLEDDRQPLLFAPEKIAEQVIRVGRQGDGKQELPVDLKQLEEEQRLITGVHEVYGEMYRLLGLDGLLPRSRYRASHDALFHVVMARIANPDSKRGSVRRLEEDFGVSLPLEKVYRMMDQLDAKAINHLRTRVGEASRSLLPEPVAILFFDCTTLYFETAVEDKLRQHGFSKDGKHRDSQVLLALMVTREGLPISYEVFPGATYEGHSLVPVLQDMQRRHQVERTVCVADRGMLSAENPWVIVGKQPNTHLSTITADWYRLRARADLDDVRIHDLRHSYASRALAAGESLSMIGKLLGHADIQSTARYAHLARETERLSAARVGGSIGADIGTSKDSPS